MTDYSDKELLALFRKEESKNYSFNLILRKYQERLYWHIRKMVVNHDDADDVLQNSFIKIWNGLNSFREDSQLFTWLYRVATNEALTFLKKKKAKYFLSMNDYESHLQNSLESDVFFEGDEIERKLNKALLTLPDKQRLVFNMKYFDNMKYDEMSEVLETSVGALKASYHHAVKKIEKYLLNN
ncbi:MAG: sigma-70 family RNA polymerase sigma factor [Bacteroidales bacterium]|jgi:RNA polymerase sigma-70 factor (ECF subfamily)|nr:sigma-70 family RNA polymerase sigma factor [Bacteroidales bacterium]